MRPVSTDIARMGAVTQRLAAVFLAAVISTQFAPHSQAFAADSGPSLTATTQWLEQNLPRFATDFDAVMDATTTANYRFYGCTLHISSEVRMKALPTEALGHPDDRVYYAVEMTPRSGVWLDEESRQLSGNELLGSNSGVAEEMTFSLKDINYDSIRLKFVTLASGQEQIPAMALLNFAPRLIRFATVDQDVAGRLLRAMRHAAQLCGSKPDVF